MTDRFEQDSNQNALIVAVTRPDIQQRVGGVQSFYIANVTHITYIVPHPLLNGLNFRPVILGR